jgi:hypothetical protein
MDPVSVAANAENRSKTLAYQTVSGYTTKVTIIDTQRPNPDNVQAITAMKRFCQKWIAVNPLYTVVFGMTKQWRPNWRPFPRRAARCSLGRQALMMRRGHTVRLGSPADAGGRYRRRRPRAVRSRRCGNVSANSLARAWKLSWGCGTGFGPAPQMILWSRPSHARRREHTTSPAPPSAPPPSPSPIPRPPHPRLIAAGAAAATARVRGRRKRGASECRRQGRLRPCESRTIGGPPTGSRRPARRRTSPARGYARASAPPPRLKAVRRAAPGARAALTAAGGARLGCGGLTDC